MPSKRSCSMVFTGMLHSALKTWKNAATLIVTSNKTPPISVKNCCNETYNVLMLKRSSKSTFFPSAHVFPGGNIEESDASSKWLEIFRPFVSDTQKLYQQFVVHQNATERSPMFLQATKSTSDLPREISYRISAIRETFEETGILLAKRRHVNTITTLNQYGEALDLKPNEIEDWRTRVSNDANEFLNMCIEKECAPDIWALHEWSNWLTPAHMFTKNSKRYDTMFFITCLKSAPVYSQQDSKEVTSMSWESPCVTLKAFQQKKVRLAPPQIYELGRLMNFKQLDDLAMFATERGLKGICQWLPVRGQTIDGAGLSLLPGDKWYPENPHDALDAVQIPLKYNQMLEQWPGSQNHIKFENLTSMHIQCTAPPSNGHVPSLNLTPKSNL